MLNKFKISIILLIVFFSVFCMPNVINAKTVTVTTAKELRDNLPFTTNDVTDIVLGANITTEDTISFYIREDSSLDLNGYTLTINSSYDLFVQHHCKTCKMTFKDSSSLKTGRLIMKKNQIYIEPSNGNCLNTNVIIDGGTYELSNSNTEYALFNLEKTSGCADYDTTENLLIKDGIFKTNRIFFAQGKNAHIKIIKLLQERSKVDGRMDIGQFNSGLALNKLSDIIDTDSEILYDNLLQTDLSKNTYDYKANSVILVRQKTNNTPEIPEDDNGDDKEDDLNQTPGEDNKDNGSSQIPGDDNKADDSNQTPNDNNKENDDSLNDVENIDKESQNKVENNKKDDKVLNPKTNAHILIYLILFIFSSIILLNIKKYIFKKY